MVMSHLIVEPWRHHATENPAWWPYPRNLWDSQLQLEKKKKYIYIYTFSTDEKDPDSLGIVQGDSRNPCSLCRIWRSVKFRSFLRLEKTTQPRFRTPQETLQPSGSLEILVPQTALLFGEKNPPCRTHGFFKNGRKNGEMAWVFCHTEQRLENSDDLNIPFGSTKKGVKTWHVRLEIAKMSQKVRLLNSIQVCRKYCLHHHVCFLHEYYIWTNLDTLKKTCQKPPIRSWMLKKSKSLSGLYLKPQWSTQRGY